VTTNEPISLLLLVLVALVAGALAGGWVANRRWQSRRERLGKQTERSAMLRGISYILANEPDMAIEELTKAAKINSETVETYVALGNLFRSKGEFERAIRIRQTIILRPNIDPETKLRALFDMGLDYRKGGLLERAISCLEDVVKSDPKRVEAYLQLESLYEEIKDWERAVEMQRQVDALRGTSQRNVLAHLSTEAGKVLAGKGDLAGARLLFKQAISTDPHCIDACLHLGDLNFKQGKVDRAIEMWRTAAEIAPSFSFLAYRRLDEAGAGDAQVVEEFLRECCAPGKDPFALVYLARHLAHLGKRDEAMHALRQALAIDPYLMEARRLLGGLLLDEGLTGEALDQYRELLEGLGSEKRFECRRCGYQVDELTWRCPGCARWDTMVFQRDIQRDSQRDSQRPGREPVA
jgi:lipopolysaccharide biosynthesis regulator YciM